MKNTRETLRRHLSPWVIVIWVALAGIAALMDQAEITIPAYIEGTEE